MILGEITMGFNFYNKKWSLPLLTRILVISCLVVQLVMLLLEIEPWQGMPGSAFSGIVMLLVIFLPNILVMVLSYTVQGQSMKSWIIFVLAAFLVVTTLPVYVHTFYFVAEIPQNAQAGVIILLLPVYQILAGTILGGIAWGAASWSE